MLARVELLLDLWIFGVPVVLMVWAVLRLTTKAPARVRYVLAIAGFAATLVVPFIAPHRETPVRMEPPAIAVAVADPIAVPLAVTWFVVAALLLLRDAIGHARLRGARRALHAAPEALKRELEWPEAVPLVVSEHAAPFTVGLVRPAVVLPADLRDRFSSAVVRRIARHELSHARWRDPLVFAILRAAAAIFWVAPVWLVLRWVRREREAAADAAALRGTRGEEETYVAALVGLSRLRPSRELAPAMAASDLEYRARRILAPQRLSIAAVLVFAAAAMLLSVAVPAQLEGVEPLVIRSRAVIVDRPQPVEEVNVVPSTKPRRARAKRETPATAAPVEEVAAEEILPISRDFSSLQPPESPPPAIHRHVDVDRHVDVARHVEDGPKKDDERIRIVIRR